MTRILSKLVLGLCLLILTLFALVWLLSPSIVRYLAQEPLAELGYRLDENSSVRLNPFNASLNIEALALSTAADNKTVFTLEQARLDLDSFGLLDQTLKIDELYLAEIFIHARQDDQGLSFAGFNIAADTNEPDSENSDVSTDIDGDTNNNGAANDKSTANNSETATQSEQDWQLLLNEFRIAEVTLLFEHFEQKHTLKLNNLSSEQLQVSAADQYGALAIDLSVNDNELAATLDFALKDAQGNATLILEANELNPGTFAYLLPDQIEQLQAQAALSTTQHITLSEAGIALNIETLNLAIHDYALVSQGIAQQLAELTLTLSPSQVRLEDERLSFALKPRLKLNNLSVSPSKQANSLLSLNSLATEQLTLTQDPEQNLAISLAALNLNDIELSKPEGGEALFSSKGISLNGLKSTLSALGNSTSHIESLALKPFTSSIQINSSGELANLVAIAPAKPEPKAQAAEQEQSREAQPPSATTPEKATVEAQHQVVLERFFVNGSSQVKVSDDSAKPAFKQNFTINTLTLGKIDTIDTRLSTPFELNALAGQYGQIALQGDIQAFADKLNLALTSTVKEFSLPKVSPYVRGAAGFDLLAGQFDLNSELKVVDDEMTGESVLALRGLELEKAQDVKQGDIVENSFIPLNLALGSLKDSNGNIEIDVELSGNVNDPDVGLDGFVYLITQKAVLAAAESYAINTFVPYANIISIARAAGSYALKVRVDDLVYPVQQVALSQDQQAFVAALAAIFKEKPELQIKMCPIATPAEAQPEAKDLSKAENLSALTALATQRGQALKERLIKEHQVASSRMLLCQARIDASEDAQPRIEFNI